MPRILVCAWCAFNGTTIKLLTASTTHGICHACLKRIFGLEPWELPVHNFPVRKPSKPLKPGPIKIRGHLDSAEDFHVR